MAKQRNGPDGDVDTHPFANWIALKSKALYFVLAHEHGKEDQFNRYLRIFEEKIREIEDGAKPVILDVIEVSRRLETKNG